ncbi:MAG: hypothetical protein E7505_04280 [Ruminococcus sp.]|nr:hypothetical protein [Ruminococcus sp.]
MAYVGQVSIRDGSHMGHAIDYISREEKALSLNNISNNDMLNTMLNHLLFTNKSIGERATYINCTQNPFKDFENMRKAFDKDKGVIAHHYFQSFQKDDDITPEQAHLIGVQLAQKMFQNYQVVVATHTDKEHLHNHIIVNSCNMVTGQKWYSNKKSLSDIRKESDKLCLQNGLGVIQKNSKYKNIDEATYQLGMKKKSWKIQLVYDLNEAVKLCRSKDDFIKFLSDKDYSVRYKDVHITITKNGEKKGIRVDTLAKQFGEKYTKENLEKQMGYYVPLPKNIADYYSGRKEKKKTEVRSNWEHYEKRILKKQNCFPSTINNVYRDKRTENMIKKAERSVASSRNVFELLIRTFVLLTALKKRQSKKKYKTTYYSLRSKSRLYQNNRNNTYGNISYRELCSSSGETFTIKVDAVNLLKLANQPILYSALMQDNFAKITVKEKDKKFLMKLLGMDSREHMFDIQNEQINNQNIYRELKQKAESNNQKLQYLVIDKSQLELLKANYISFAYFSKEDKYNIAFLPEKLKIIQKILHDNKQSENIRVNIRNEEKVNQVMLKNNTDNPKKIR